MDIFSRCKGGSQLIHLMICLQFLLIMAQFVPTITFHNQYQVTAMLFFSFGFSLIYLISLPTENCFTVFFKPFTGNSVACSFLFHIVMSLSHGIFHIYSHNVIMWLKCFIYSRASDCVLCHLQRHFGKNDGGSWYGTKNFIILFL